MKSELPLWIQYSQALALPALALVGAFIAFLQYRTAHDKLRLDLFDRRLQVFIDVSKFIGNVRQASRPELADLKSLFRALDSAEFLFDKEVKSYLRNLHEIAHELRVTYNKINNTDGSEREIFSQKNADLYSDFDKLGDQIVPIFSNYMRFSRVKEHKNISLQFADIRKRVDMWRDCLSSKGKR